MATESNIEDHLFLIIGLGELEEQDPRRQIINIGETQSQQALMELVGDDLRETNVSL